jgi:TPR repeat protein
MLFRPRLVPTATLLALLALTACRRPGPSLADDHPGIDPKPAGQALWDNVPVTDPERGVIDLSRPESPGRSFDPSSEDDVAYKAAMRGEAWAQTKLGKSYVTAPDDPDRFQQGLDFLRRAAEKNDAEALLELSSLATSGNGLPQSDLEAFDYCLRSAKAGLDQAQFRVGKMFASGKGTAQDGNAAVSWFRKAAVQGYAPAKYALALALLESSEKDSSKEEAIGWLQSAAEDGHREATFFLAGATAHGDYGLVKDEKKAAEMATPSAEAGDAEFQFALATLLLKGDTFADQRADGKKWLEKAAASGHAGAKQLLQEQYGPAQ